LVGFGREPAGLLQKIMAFEFLIKMSRPMPPARPLTLHAMHVAPISALFFDWFCKRASIKRCAFIGLGFGRHVIEHLRQIVNRIGGMFPA
jgi:hypothetical protein